MWHFPAALLKGKDFKRSPAKKQTWPGLEVLGEEFRFYLEIPVVSGCQERTNTRLLGCGSPILEAYKDLFNTH